MEDDSTIYIFTFSPINNTASLNMTYTVYSEKPEEVEMFLKQHNMDNGIEYINVSTYEKADVDDIQMLKPYKFGSNRYRDKMYTIYTSHELVELAVRDTVNEMMIACEFNMIITRDTELPLISHIKEMVDKTTFGYALDLERVLTKKCDEYNDTKYHLSSDKRKWKFGGYYPGEQYVYSDDEDDSSNELGDALLGIMESCSIMPITMEAYIESFVSTITDDFS